MEENRFFRTINRVNSLLILITAIGVIVALSGIFISTNQWGKRNAVEVVTEKGKKSNDNVDFRLGTLERMKGTSVQTVQLMSSKVSRGFSSGYSGGEIRNVLYLSEPELNPRWLYDRNDYLISCFCKLSVSKRYNDDAPVLLVYVTVIKQDQNKDGILSEDDRVTLALLNPEGTNYTEVASNINRVMDAELSEDGERATFILQIGQDVLVRQYSVRDFTLTAERKLTEIRKSL